MTATLLDRPSLDKPSLDRPGGEGADAWAERQIVALHLGDEIYGVDIERIHTVLMPQPITALPNVSPDIKGVMNLRGRILPVLDLRARFGMEPLTAEGQKSARVVIVEADGLTAGLIVDSVSEVLRLPAGAVEPPSVLLGASEGDCLTGIARIPGGRRREDPQADGERLLLLLDISRTLRTLEAAS